mgnify:CR=1 FL=1
MGTSMAAPSGSPAVLWSWMTTLDGMVFCCFFGGCSTMALIVLLGREQNSQAWLIACLESTSDL